MLDLVLTNGTVVTPTGPVACDIGIEGGRIAVLDRSGAIRNADARSMDVAGRLLVPGGIDPHVHTSWVIPTAAHLGIPSAGPEQVTRAAAYGGTTTVVDFATWQEGESLSEAPARKGEEYAQNSYVDHTFHCIVRGQIPANILAEVPDLITSGYPTIKVFMTNTTPGRPPQKTDLGYIWALLQKIAVAGGMLAVHAEDDDIVMYSYDEFGRTGRTGFENVHLVHSDLSEALSFRRIIELAARTAGALYLMHVSAAEGVLAVEEARARNLPVYAETLQHYLCFVADDYRREHGQIFHTYPSLKGPEDQARLWEGLKNQAIGTVATDEMCTNFEMKVRGKTIGDVTGGHAGVEVRMGLMYTEAVVKRGYSLLDYVGMTSTNAAKILGLYPQKGALAVGSDADIAVMAVGKRTLRQGDLHETDYSVWDGWEVEAWPESTILRGQVIVDHGRLVGSTMSGSEIRRKIDRKIVEQAC